MRLLSDSGGQGRRYVIEFAAWTSGWEAGSLDSRCGYFSGASRLASFSGLC